VSGERKDRRTVGRVLSDMLADKKLTHVAASQQVNGAITPSKLSGVVNGHRPMTLRTAVVLEALTGRSAEEWLLHGLAKELEVTRASVSAEIAARAKQSAANAANAAANAAHKSAKAD
jgi:plasmid maintenance system antidote protein VapI